MRSIATCADARRGAVPARAPVLGAEAGLRRELALFDRVAAGAIRSGAVFWRSERAIIAPRSAERQSGFGEAAEAMARRDWPVVLRATGGDVVPQSVGLLNIAISFRAEPSPDFGINAAYRLLCGPLIEALARLGVDACCGKVPGALCDGDFNLVVDGRKLAGTAQRWRRLGGADRGSVAILAEAAILVDADLATLVGVANEFYHRLGVPRRIEAERHVTVAQLLPALTLEMGVESLMNRLAGEIAAALPQAGSADAAGAP
jgi:lipoate-protein ligase A